MKILSATDIKFVDDYTITHEPISSVALVERVAEALRNELLRLFSTKKCITIICGKGKNAADGMALALKLVAIGAYKTRLLLCYPAQELCQEAAHLYARIQLFQSIKCEQISKEKLPTFTDRELIIDALFGTGLNRALTGYEKQLVQSINKSQCPIISIDIPSGMMSEDNTKNDPEAVVQAHHTFTLNAPKLALLLPEYGNFGGQLHVLDIGLHPTAIEPVDSKWRYTTTVDLAQILKPRKKFSHKGNYGHALLVAGSQGMIGAAVLASRACLHSGIGLLTTHVPKCGVDIMQTAVSEAMIDIDDNEKYFSNINLSEKIYSAIAIGCGIGQNDITTNALKSLLQNISTTPLVLDADALNIVAENKMLHLLPKNCIITPHVKEFERLFGTCGNSIERLQKQQQLAQQYEIIVVLKGAHTAVALPNGTIYFNSTGNPGMSTAGSGDVLTGVILSLLGQGYNSTEAAILGVGMHGLAGDEAAKQKSQMYITASDIIEHLHCIEHIKFSTNE